jgi:hypothetical protein
LFEQYPTLTTREFAELSEISLHESEEKLEELSRQKEVNKYATKNGVLWVVRNKE